jgi:hypothetical protein
MDNTRLRQLNRAYARKQGMSFESVIDEFRRFSAEDDSFSKFVFKPTTYPKHRAVSKQIVFDKAHAEIAALILSDWHTAETIRPEDSNGINKYNSVIMSNRAYSVIDKFKRIVRGHQAMYRIEKLWLLLLGDMISGSIHDELVLTNDLLDVPAAILTARILILAILELRSLGLPIEIDCTVGNHPRLLMKMPSKRQAHLSYDWLIYVMLQQYFEDDKEVTIRIHTGQFGLVNQYEHRVVIEHGYHGKAQELESHLRDIFDNPIYRKATGLEGTAVDFVIIGDKHQAEVGESYMVNGCLSGSNEYGLALRASPVGAVQQMFGISRRRIPSWVYPLSVTEVVSEHVDNSFSQYASQFMKEHGRT